MDEKKSSEPNFLFEQIRRWNNYLAVFGLSTLISTKNQIYEISYYRMAYSIILMTLLISLFSFQILGSSFSTDNIVAIIMRAYLNVVGNLVTALTVLSSIIASEKCAKMETNLAEIDRKYSSLDEGKPKSVSIRYIFIPLSIFLLSLIMDVAQYSSNSYLEVMGWNMLVVLSVHISLLYNILQITQFSVFLYWLKILVKTINIGLKNSVVEDEDFGLKDKEKINFLNADAKKKETLFEITFRLPMNGNIAAYSKNKKSLEKVKLYRILYHDIYQLTQQINHVFATRIVLTVGHNFILGVIFLYSTVNDLIDIVSGSTDFTVTEIIFHVKWSILSFLSIFGLIWPSRITSSEAYNTVILVHELLITPLGEDLKSELHSFALQFLHDQISFTPHGFFNLNNKLLLSVLGAVASYLVVLIQFRVPMQ